MRYHRIYASPSQSDRAARFFPGDQLPDFDPRAYWTGLVEGASVEDLHEVGHPDMGRSFNRAAYRLRLRAVLKAIGNTEEEMTATSIFEAAFGVGYYLSAWEAFGCARVTAVDIAERARENVQLRFPQYDLRTADVAELHELPDWSKLRASFGLVTAIDMMYHIVDDARAFQAMHNLVSLVDRGGLFLVTDKFGIRDEPVRETAHVVRRPLSWYTSIAEDHGLTLAGLVPAFWCMDPPASHGRRGSSFHASRSIWRIMRLMVKPLPRNGPFQNVVGSVVGAVGASIDRAVLRRGAVGSNLVVAAFRNKVPRSP